MGVELCCSDMEDLRDRLIDAVAELTQLIDSALARRDAAMHKRLTAKRTGVLLALDYIRAYHPGGEGV